MTAQIATEIYNQWICKIQKSEGKKKKSNEKQGKNKRKSSTIINSYGNSRNIS